ncbi:hypothetical protein B5F76_04295 [Desulfovibrio sp. An276]|uniref:outer membrane homotrimeric porin n=1 Tax=Desulfovibrio sp. An276 TaxID=1965618 RepID=UPI000B36E3D0|nr:outer membrane homotrimeric porin [Desulfovibrio sp. An276]OUO54041.1 hypothetical protein B5F76_04295 [Desulfovibrio sp. An276]
MKKLMTLILAAGLFFAGTVPSANAIEFKAQGEWLMGFGAGDASMINKARENRATSKSKYNNDDKFSAMQRVRLQLDAVASENLSGTVLFELLESTWGQAESGGALGADEKIVGVLNAYIDWAVPNTDLKVRMGLQPIEMPNVAGGSSILNTDALAAVTLNYQFNENVGATLMWGRPYNDNYSAWGADHSNNKNNFLDNVDLIALSVPITFDGIEVTPWVMYGIIGQNAGRSYELDGEDPVYTGSTDLFSVNSGLGHPIDFERRHANTSAFWAGLPFKLSLWDPLNIEVDLNYGYVQSAGRGDIKRSDGTWKRIDSKREGWLAKALIEYKMDWGTPGIFGWYASGDDSNVKNGSERLPAIEAKGNFTSMMGDDNFGWASNSCLYDSTLNYAGTWGIGLQLKEMSFLEDLTHTFRVAYWGGTNSPEMAKYANDPTAWNNQGDFAISDGLYLTRNDGLLEFNLINSYQMYENFEINLELGYMVNFFDQDTWKKAGHDTYAAYEKQDAWKAQLIFAYTF